MTYQYETHAPQFFHHSLSSVIILSLPFSKSFGYTHNRLNLENVFFIISPFSSLSVQNITFFITICSKHHLLHHTHTSSLLFYTTFHHVIYPTTRLHHHTIFFFTPGNLPHHPPSHSFFLSPSFFFLHHLIRRIT